VQRAHPAEGVVALFGEPERLLDERPRALVVAIPPGVASFHDQLADPVGEVGCRAHEPMIAAHVTARATAGVGRGVYPSTLC
jgi:hypothetical protein